MSWIAWAASAAHAVVAKPAYLKTAGQEHVGDLLAGTTPQPQNQQSNPDQYDGSFAGNDFHEVLMPDGSVKRVRRDSLSGHGHVTLPAETGGVSPIAPYIPRSTPWSGTPGPKPPIAGIFPETRPDSFGAFMEGVRNGLLIDLNAATFSITPLNDEAERLKQAARDSQDHLTSLGYASGEIGVETLYLLVGAKLVSGGGQLLGATSRGKPVIVWLSSPNVQGWATAIGTGVAVNGTSHEVELAWQSFSEGDDLEGFKHVERGALLSAFAWQGARDLRKFRLVWPNQNGQVVLYSNPVPEFEYDVPGGITPGQFGVAPATKTVPNPGGRLGDAVTRAKTQDVIQDLQSRGFTQIRQEVRFRPGSLGSGRERFADVVGRNPITGETEIIQIGRTITRDPRVPIIRERDALDDIIFSPDIQNFPNTTIRFVDVNRPGVIQP